MERPLRLADGTGASLQGGSRRLADDESDSVRVAPPPDRGRGLSPQAPARRSIERQSDLATLSSAAMECE